MYIKILYERLLSSLGCHLRQLKERHPFVPVALKLLNNPVQSGTSAAQWMEYRWSLVWQENAHKLQTFLGNVGPTPPGISFPRPAWVKLNRLRISVGLFRSEAHK